MSYPNQKRGRGGGFNRNKYYNRNSNKSSKDSQAGGSAAVSISGTNARAVTLFLNENTGQYKSWKLYFPLEEYSEFSETVKKIESFEKYVTKKNPSLDVGQTDTSSSINLDIQKVLDDKELLENWCMLSDDILNKPEHTLACMSIATQKVLEIATKVNVRLLNHQPILSLSNLKVNYYGKLVTVKGTVIRVGSVGLKCLSMAFKCSSCHNKQAVLQPQGIFTTPTFCNSCQTLCKFEALQSSNFTTTIDWQTLKIQEMQNQGISGTIPRSVEVELQGDLVSSVNPGDVALITGIVRVHGEAKAGEDNKKTARLLQLYIEAVSVQSQKNLSHPSLTFTERDCCAIQEIHGCGDVLRLLVHSLCPSIYGHEMVKAGLVLGLMGGKESDKNCRSNPHILIVGDPGLGKSQLLQSAALAAPRGVYVCGASASASGLTVALGRDSGGDYALEAGALVLADRGVCCVDELDKMSANHGSLLEAMEQRTVSIAKGGVVCCLSARATVLAAANPVGGHYNRAKTVSENLKMSSPLLSRFDLVFILLDQPNERMDALLSEHVLAMHSGKARLNRRQDNNMNCSSGSGLNDTLSKENTLSESLRLKPGETVDPLPLVLLRKYIAYAQKYVHPKLSTEAANQLRDFYLQLRKLHESENTPITTRQLEACIRLTQARARVDLREKATAQDAKDVIELMKHCLVDTFSDEFGEIQLSRSVFGSGMSSRSAIKKFIEILTTQAAQGKDTFSKKELCHIHKMKGLSGNVIDLIESLQTHGYLLVKKPGVYKVLSA